MPLWRVDIENVSYRYVEAVSKKDAIDAVVKSFTASLSFSAESANDLLNAAFEKGGPNQRKALLLALDGLHGPSRKTRDLERQITRLQGELERQQAWVRDTVGRAPPADPERIEQIAR